MWGLLGSSKEASQEGSSPATTAPPPMMFNPLTTNTAVKSKTSRNPLSRQKRPTALAAGPGNTAAQQQPFSPTSPVAPQPEQVSPQSPLSPSSKQPYNVFPNFNSSDANPAQQHQDPSAFPQHQDPSAFPQQQDSSAPSGQSPSNTQNLDQFLSNYEYGNTPIQENTHPVDSNLNQDDANQYNYPNEAEEATNNNAESSATDNMYQSEEQYNSAYYQHYGAPPPAGSWEGYQQSWAQYFQTQTNEAPYQAQTNEAQYQAQTNEAQYQPPQNEAQYQAQQNYQENEAQYYQQGEPAVAHQAADYLANNENNAPQAVVQRHPSNSSGGQNDWESRERHPSQSRERYDSQSRERYDSQSRERHDSQTRERYDSQSRERQDSQSRERQDSQSRDRHDSQASSGRRHNSNSLSNQAAPLQFESTPFATNNFDPTHQSTPSHITNTAGFFDQNPANSNNAAALFQQEHPPQGLSQPEQPPPVVSKNVENMSPYDYNQPVRNSQTSLANPDNQFQKERDSTTPLWEKKDLDMIADSNYTAQNLPQNMPQNLPQNMPSPHQNTFERQLSYSDRSRNSSSTAENQYPGRARSSSSTSRSQMSDSLAGSRSRTTSSTHESVITAECVQPPPQFTDSNAGVAAPATAYNNPGAEFHGSDNANTFDHIGSTASQQANSQGAGYPPESAYDPQVQMFGVNPALLNQAEQSPNLPEPHFELGPPQLASASEESIDKTAGQQQSQPSQQWGTSSVQHSDQFSNQMQHIGGQMTSPQQQQLMPQQMPPPSQQMPPQSQQMPLPGHQMPPPGHQMAPPIQQMPPPTQQKPPQSHQMAPPSQQMPPPGHQMAPPSQQMPPQSQQMPPPIQQMPPPGHQMAPPIQQNMPPPGHQMAPPAPGPQMPPQSQQISPQSQQMPQPGFRAPPPLHPQQSSKPPPAFRPHNFGSMPLPTKKNAGQMSDAVLMPPPPAGMYEKVNLRNNPQPNNTNTVPQPLSLNNMPVTFARPIGHNGSHPSSRPSSRGSDDTIARLRKEYEERKIIKRGTPDSIGNISGEAIGPPLMNSTANNGSRKLASLSMKSLRNMSQKTASIISAQQAYENVVLKNEKAGASYENHELFSSRKGVPALPPKPSLPPRPTPRKDTRSDRPEVRSAQGHYRSHKRTSSLDSGNSFKSDAQSRSKSFYNDNRYHDASRSRDDRYNRDGSRSRDERDNDRSKNVSQYDYDRDRYQQRLSEFDRYRRDDILRREEMARRGAHPEAYYAHRGYDRGYGAPNRNYPYRLEDYNNRRGYYDNRSYYPDRSDELSISHSESNRSDPNSHTNETDDIADSSDALKEPTDTDALLSDSKDNLLDNSEELSDEDDAAVQDSVVEPEEEEEACTALADLYTAPYLYTRSHVRAQCFAPNRFVCVLPGDDEDAAPPQVDISEFKLLYWQELKEIEAYPGPFIKGETPKRDVMSYCKKQACGLRKDGGSEGKILLWELMALICKQNGVVIGTDVSELLLADQDTSVAQSHSSITGYQTEDSEVTEEQKTEAVNKIRECLFEGQRKEALEVSVKYCLWDVALMISSTLSADMMSDTMQRFSNSLHSDDPLKSFHQLVSNTEPTVCTANLTTDNPGNWRTHLAMILSNQSDKYDPNFNYVLTLANTLASAGMVYESHFACLMAGSKLTSVIDKTSPIALLGLDHTKADLRHLPYTSIQLTEIYEYARLLGGETCIVPYQAVKLFYAREVAKVGHYSKALRYLQQISNNINFSPKSYRARFIQRVYDECIRLLHILAIRQLPEWTEKLRETLRNRNLGISNRSTAYSSRVATPDIQRVAQYLLHKQKQNVAVSEPPSAVNSDLQTAVNSDLQSVNQQASTEAQQQQLLHHQELLANGLVFDGQVYRHEMYPGWYYYEDQWYADASYQTTQQDTSNQSTEQEQSYQYSTEANQQYTADGNQQYTADGNQQYTAETDQQSPDVTHHQQDESGQEYSYQTDGSQGNSYQASSYLGDSNQASSYLGDSNQASSYLGDSNQVTADVGYPAPGETSEQDPGFYSNQQYSNDNTGYTEPGFHDNQHASLEYTPADYSIPEEDGGVEVDGSPQDMPIYGDQETEGLPRQRQDTLTNEEKASEPPQAPSFTFFNPAQFGSGGGNNLMAPLVPQIAPPAPEHATSDDEIKTPTNDPTEDALEEDEDSVYSKKKPAKEETKEEPKQSEGLFSRLFKRGENKKRMILPDDSKPTIYWDDALGKYVDTTADAEVEVDTPPPPTISLPASSRSSVSGAEDKTMSAPASPGGSFRRKPVRGRLAANRYVDVMAGSGMRKSATAPSFN